MSLLNQRQRVNLIRKSQVPKLDIKTSNYIYSFPFKIILGTANSSEIGITTKDYDPADFGGFEKVFSGRDSVLVNWENSTSAKKINDNDTFLTKEYQPGIYKRGIRLDTITSVDFSESNVDTDFVAQRSKKTIKIRYDDWEIQDRDLFKFYIIPQSNTDNLFYISEVVSYFNIDDNSLLYTVATFNNITNELSRSGRSITNYPQFSAPGEGYAFPILNNENTKTPLITLDEFKLRDRPIDEIQVEVFGASIMSGITVFGRKTGLIKDGDVWKNDTKIQAPKLLFPFQLKTPISSDISKTSASETNYYVIVNGAVDLVSNWKNWKENIASSYDITKTKNYEGVILTDKTKTQDTNTGGIKKEVWTDYNIDFSKVIPPTANASFYLKQDIDFSGLTSISITKFLMLNSVYFLDTERLPISLTETTTWSIKNIPIIGAFLNILTLGIPIGWNNTDVILEAKKINGLIPTNLYDLGTNGELISTEGALAMDLFRNDTSDSIGALTGTNNITSAIRFSLTDKVQQEGIENDTLDLGQESTHGGKGWKMDEHAQPSNPLLASHEGFILDLINLKFIGKADYTITAFSKGAKVYESKYQSKSKFSEAAREWSNTIKLSNWAEINNKTISYPEAIIPPKPAIIDIVEEVDINLESNVGNYDFWYKQDLTDDQRNLHLNYETFNFDITKYFNGTIKEITAKEYKYANLVYELSYQLTTDKYERNTYTETLTIDLNDIGDADKLINNRVLKDINSWTWGDYGSGKPDYTFGDLGFRSNIDFILTDTNTLTANVDLKLDWRTFRYGAFSGHKNPQQWELNGDWPIKWFIKVKLLKLKLSK